MHRRNFRSLLVSKHLLAPGPSTQLGRGGRNNAPPEDRVRIVESTTQCAQAGAALLTEAVQQSICIPDFCPNPGEGTALLLRPRIEDGKGIWSHRALKASSLILF